MRLAVQVAASCANQWRGSWTFHKALICHLNIYEDSCRNKKIVAAISWPSKGAEGEAKLQKKLATAGFPSDFSRRFLQYPSGCWRLIFNSKTSVGKLMQSHKFCFKRKPITGLILVHFLCFLFFAVNILF